MTLIHGKVITKKRFRLIRDYVKRRDHEGFVRLSMVKDYREWQSYDEWVRGFERFMIHGFGPTPKGRTTQRIPRQAVRLAVPDHARPAQAGQGDV